MVRIDAYEAVGHGVDLLLVGVDAETELKKSKSVLFYFKLFISIINVNKNH